MSYTYLLVNLLTVIICFIFSYHPKIKFNQHFGAFIKASVLVAVPFIIWDIIFTKNGVWWFNLDYTVGLVLGGLPIEEWMFFIFIPFSCVFTYYCLDKFFDLSWASGLNNTIVFISIVGATVMALLHSDLIYTFITALALIGTLIYLHFITYTPWIGQASMVYTLLMLGFFPVNGVLTGTGLESPIVNYNPEDFLGIRMLTIPVEDAVYGYVLFLWVLYFFKIFQRRDTASAIGSVSVNTISSK